MGLILTDRQFQSSLEKVIQPPINAQSQVWKSATTEPTLTPSKVCNAQRFCLICLIRAGAVCRQQLPQSVSTLNKKPL